MAPRFRMQVPSFVPAECGNTIWKKVVLRHELDRDRGPEILEELLAYPMHMHETEALTLSAYELAHGIGAPKLAIRDFIYPALAEALDCRLVLADRLFYDALPTPLAPRLLWVADPK